MRRILVLLMVLIFGLCDDDVSEFVDFNDCLVVLWEEDTDLMCPRTHVGVGVCSRFPLDPKPECFGGYMSIQCCRLKYGGWYLFVSMCIN